MQKNSSQRKRRFVAEYLIVVEGESEQIYFEGLKNRLPQEIKRKLNIKIIKADPGNALIFVKNAIDYQKKLSPKKTYVVFDDDNFNNKQKAFELAEKHKIKVIYTSICFEFWLLLHFSYTTVTKNKCADIIKLLKKQEKNYKKAKLYDNFYPLTEQAIANAEKLMRWNIQDFKHKKIWEKNPYTNIHILLQELFNF